MTNKADRMDFMVMVFTGLDMSETLNGRLLLCLLGAYGIGAGYLIEIQQDILSLRGRWHGLGSGVAERREGISTARLTA